MHTKNSVSTHTLKPMNRETATLLATRLLGSYPSLNLHDPETFMTELVVAFLKYPQWVGEQAVVDAKRASPIYVPSVPLVEKSCEDAIVQTRQAFTYAQQWERQTQLQLEERKAIDYAAEQEPLEQRRAVVARLWPRALDEPRGTTRDIGAIQNPPKQGFRQFSADDLRAIYPSKAAACDADMNSHPPVGETRSPGFCGPGDREISVTLASGPGGPGATGDL